ncbi:MAG TPA: hypothetical protein VM487_24060 [Phycisphaerae bacterium]|nr:hypothetical protein [Phycisphaerae bacterium]
MAPKADLRPDDLGRRARLLGGVLVALWACGGCGLLWTPTELSGLVEGAPGPTDTLLAADVTAASPETGLPTTLSGVVSGQFEGQYQEEILEVFFDDGGAPIAAISRSEFSLDSPASGTLVSLNLIVVVDFIIVTDDGGTPVLDEQGSPIVCGLQTSATGEIIHGTGSFVGVTGKLHTESVLSFSSGSCGMGAVEADLVITLDGDVAD